MIAKLFVGELCEHSDHRIFLEFSVKCANMIGKGNTQPLSLPSDYELTAFHNSKL